MFSPSGAPRSPSTVPAQLVEEPVDDVEFTPSHHFVVDEPADREIEHPEPEG